LLSVSKQEKLNFLKLPIKERLSFWNCR